ncbi:hypothetical protein [Phytoactinopolyspora limicola]|uniref:hypothetical protein n=1 Tax=Phytoactinopolyspora limicola TaxID=2715536 RepID=UPI001A9C9E4E|nr:hypothetical protein [Phytoactinopolyspora limicola]
MIDSTSADAGTGSAHAGTGEPEPGHARTGEPEPGHAEAEPPRGPIRRALGSWRSWAGYAAAVWSFGYGALGLLWTLGVPGFPFGEGDAPGARHHSMLGEATAAGAGPWIAVLGFAGGLAGIGLARARARGTLRSSLIASGWIFAVVLILFIPDHRVLMTIAYTPAILALPFGWPPMGAGEFFALLYPWTNLNLVLCALGGVLFAAATVAFHLRTLRACPRCGRRPGATESWTTPAAAARWGRWAAYTAALVPFTYAVVRWLWAFGVPFTVSREFLDELHEDGLVWAGAYLATLGALGGILTLGLVQRWGVIWPRWVLGRAGRRVPPMFPIMFASIVAVALASAGMVMVRLTDWTDPEAVVSNPGVLWPLWAVALGAAALAYHFRTRGACRRCGTHPLM